MHLHDRLSVRARANGVSVNRQLTRGYPTPSVSIDVPGETARTVEVRLRGRNCLNLAEIEVYGSGAGGGDRPPLAYGSTWHFAEGAGTTFVWKRRRGTDVIDVVQPDGSPAWTSTNKQNGNQVTLDRPDLGHYTGAIAPDERSASSTATWYSPGQKWAARMSNHDSGGLPPQRLHALVRQHRDEHVAVRAPDHTTHTASEANAPLPPPRQRRWACPTGVV